MDILTVKTRIIAPHGAPQGAGSPGLLPVDDAQPRSAGQSGRRADTAQARKAPAAVFVRPEETESVLNEEVDMTDFEQVRDSTIVDMLYTTGMRCSELTGLTDAGVDLYSW